MFAEYVFQTYMGKEDRYNEEEDELERIYLQKQKTSVKKNKEKNKFQLFKDEFSD